MINMLCFFGGCIFACCSIWLADLIVSIRAAQERGKNAPPHSLPPTTFTNATTEYRDVRVVPIHDFLDRYIEMDRQANWKILVKDDQTYN